MLFNLFRKKENKAPVRNLVWIDRQAKLQGCKQLLHTKPNAVVAAWFNSTIQYYQQELGKDFTDIQVRNARQVPAPLSENKSVILLEHYPLLSKEIEHSQYWKASEILIVNSLDEPLFLYFGGERLSSLMEKMGMNTQECIEHSLISSSIENAQKKIAGILVTEHSASSPEEWFRLNLPHKHSS